MAEGTGNEEQNDQRRFLIQKVYVKDVSFETPNTPQIFQENWEPDVNVQLGNTAKALAEGVYEIVITVTVTAKVGDKTAYLAEVHQAGIFTIEGFAEEEIGPMVGSHCPNILFPFAREAVSDFVTKGGFPQLVLSPVNFEAVYAQHVQQMQQQQGEVPQPGSTH